MYDLHEFIERFDILYPEYTIKSYNSKTITNDHIIKSKYLSIIDRNRARIV